MNTPSTSRLVSGVLLLSVCLSVQAGDNKDQGTPQVSPDQVKKTCKAVAQQDGFSVGDFGDVGFDKKSGTWVTKMNVQGSGEKFKARCEWNGHGAPRLTVWDGGQDIMTRKYSKMDVVKACKAQALSMGYEVGDFGDTEFDSRSGVWMSKLMVRRPGQEKTKVRCRWDGRQSPVIE